ncbi:MFS transporter [Hazenella sp. IB182353]|uniref:MFS transporter n=1 Tax=Polycladospora coralii TaxID=2771432 RepID=UPI001746B471|nr:MFS transporter [Polycladospora coralii]MBS7529966.1 MFS transporter [Polycladospora coralii]
MKILGNIDRLDKEAWLLLLENGLFHIASALSDTFVNVYLWKIKHDWILISWFNFTHYLVGALTFILAGWLTKKVDRVIAVRLGVLMLSIFYVSVLFLGKQSVHYVILLGVIKGLGSGFFWMAYNVLYFEITERHNRDIYNGINGLIYSTAGIIAPFISGLIITKINHFTGYRIIFSISLSVFIAAVFVSFLYKRRHANRSYQLKKVIDLLKDKKNHWYWVSLAMVAQGLREGSFIFLIGLLVYVTTKSELTLGTYLTIASLVSLLSFYVVGKYLKPKRRNAFIFLGTLMMAFASVPLAFHVNQWTVFIFGVGSALFYPFYMSPLTSTVFDVIGENQDTANLRIEYVVVRELALTLGRLVSILLFIWWVNESSSLLHIRWYAFVIGFVQLFAWLAIRKVPLLAESFSRPNR